uniref:Ubiquitin-like domain-containing protein n=1 Tax=Alexandrium monilatum TaxID=311494 RepID=A0A7S4SRB9_9DINO|mmetsp:Transcript_87993/g.272528  ORF Transcript_87993/g.272528 Transcript_87993/m.272528 type:complete len:369 (-) Transcript_87993:88-1194(-)
MSEEAAEDGAAAADPPPDSPKACGPLEVSVRTLAGATVDVSGLCDSDSLVALLDRIAAVAGVPRGEQRLLLGGEAVPTADLHAPLSSLGIRQGAECALVRVGVPHSGRYVGLSNYEEQAVSYEVWFDGSTWRWLDVGRGLLEFELVYRVLESSNGDAVGCVGAEVLEGVYDWDDDSIQASGVFLRAVPQEVATLSPPLPSSEPMQSAAAAERAARPWWVGLSREELCAEVHHRMDADRDGRLLSGELRSLAESLGWEGGDEEWEELYQVACNVCGSRPEVGFDAAQLHTFIDQSTVPAGTIDLATVLATVLEEQDRGPSDAAWGKGQRPLPLHRFLSRTPSVKLSFASGGQQVQCRDDLTFYVLERLP